MNVITILPSREEFHSLARTGNVIPIYADIVADGETPISAFQKLDDGTFSFLFESAEQNEESGRYSFLGFHPRLVVQRDGQKTTIEEKGQEETFKTENDPLTELENVMRRFKFVSRSELPRFAGGAVGFLGYDIAHYFEPTIPLASVDELGLPEMIFMIMRTLVIFDHRFRRVKLIVNVFLDDDHDTDREYDSAAREIESTLAKLSQSTDLGYIDAQRSVSPGQMLSNMTREKFEALVETAQRYIESGDIFQVVLSQCFETDFKGAPLDLYRCLRLVNPSPYMFCLRFGERFSLVGSSPELHVRASDEVVELRPIAGTRRRGRTPAEDARNAKELLADAKERAEHVMLLDLARNDLGRIAEVGSIRVTEQMAVERYSHVMHLVSRVVARLRAGQTAYDVMRATFPAGTVSGAPKIRAMQIISELEKQKRGCYAGAVGYFGFDGALDCCIALRSVVLKNGRAYVQAGAGIVADSNPAAEYREILSKATAMIEAIARATEIR